MRGSFMKPLRPWLIRLFAFLMLLWCFQQGWAGVLIQKGSLEAAYAIDPRNPEVLFKLGKDSLKAQNPSARNLFEQFLDIRPNSGEGWFYLGLAAKSEEGSTQAHSFFDRALEVSSGDAWLSYHIGKELLESRDVRKSEDNLKAIRLIQESIALHQPNRFSPFVPKGSPFLKPALELLWKETEDLSVLKQIVPEEIGSYLVFIHFLKGEQLWKEYALIYPKFLKIQAQTYDKLCRAGDAFLQKGAAYQALKMYRKAFWIRSWSYVRAKAGVLVAQEQMETLDWDNESFLKEKPRETLRKVLTEKDEAIETLLPMLKPLVEHSGSDELQSLYQKRIEGISEQVLWSEEVYAPSSWWGPKVQAPVLNQTGWLSRPVSFPKGKSLIEIDLRSFPDRHGNYGYVLIRLNEKVMQGIYVNHSNWQKFTIPVETNGGKRSLKVDLINGAKGQARGPVVEIGSMQIKPVSRIP